MVDQELVTKQAPDGNRAMKIIGGTVFICMLLVHVLYIVPQGEYGAAALGVAILGFGGIVLMFVGSRWNKGKLRNARSVNRGAAPRPK